MESDKATWKGTIFDLDEFYHKLFYSRGSDTSNNKEIRKSQQFIFHYFLCIILYIVCFIYIFNYKRTEYMAYIFAFIINFVYPFTWLLDFRIINKSKIRSYPMYAGLFLQFLSLFFILLKNEDVRKFNEKTKKEQDKKGYHETDEKDKIKEITIKTKDKQTEHYDRVIAILFATITSLTWGIVGHTFSKTEMNESMIDTSALNNKEGFAKTMSWLLDQPYEITSRIDRGWHYYMDKINTTPLIKGFSMYCVTFIVLFFGCFIRIPKNPELLDRMDRFKMINIEHIFTAKFRRNMTDYRNTTIFFLCLFLIFITTLGGSFIIKNFVTDLTGYSYIIPFILSCITYFSAFYGSKEGRGFLNTDDSVKKLTMFLVSNVFSLLGTPVIIAIIQLFLETGLLNQPMQFLFSNNGYSIIRTLNIDLNRNFDSNNVTSHWYWNLFYSISRIALIIGAFMGIGGGISSITDDNVDKNIMIWLGAVFGLIIALLSFFIPSFLSFFAISTFFILLLIIFSMSLVWISKDAVTNFKIFNAVLITMAVSLFMGLSTHYNIFTNLYTFLRFIIEHILVYLAPITILVLSIVQFTFAMRNHKKHKIVK